MCAQQHWPVVISNSTAVHRQSDHDGQETCYTCLLTLCRSTLTNCHEIVYANMQLYKVKLDHGTGNRNSYLYPK